MGFGVVTADDLDYSRLNLYDVVRFSKILQESDFRYFKFEKTVPLAPPTCFV